MIIILLEDYLFEINKISALNFSLGSNIYV